MRPSNHQLLSTINQRVCPACEYDLRGNDNVGECPECGEVVSDIEVVLRVVRIHPPRRIFWLIRNAITVVGLAFLLLQSWYLGFGAIVGAILISLWESHAAERITLLGLSPEGITVRKRTGECNRVEWGRFKPPEFEPARHNLANRLYERLGKTARPWIIRLTFADGLTAGMTFGLLAEKGAADGLHRLLLEFFNPVGSSAHGSVCNEYGWRLDEDERVSG